MQNGIMLLTVQYGIVCSNKAECGMPQHSMSKCGMPQHSMPQHGVTQDSMLQFGAPWRSMSQYGMTQHITGHNCAIIESFDRGANKTEYYSCYG